MACPNYESDVRRLKEQYPNEWRNAHTGNAHTEDFVRIVAEYLHGLDPNVGLNGKRGNPNDISDDALNILDPVDGPGKTPDGRRCWVVDFIAAAGSPSASVYWNPFTNPQESSGAHVVPGPVEPPPPPSLKPRDRFYAEFRQINAYYAAPEGLQRPGGMVLNGQCDAEAMGAWGYDLMTGTTVEQCKAQIRQSDEWKQKHPGETP